MYLAARGLEALSFTPLCHSQTPEMFRMLASLSALTRLSLHGVDFRKAAGVNVLHKLRLLELCLDDCKGLAMAFSLPCSLPALQKLEAHEGYRPWCCNHEERRLHELDRQEAKAEAPELRSWLLSLP